MEYHKPFLKGTFVRSTSRKKFEGLNLRRGDQQILELFQKGLDIRCREVQVQGFLGGPSLDYHENRGILPPWLRLCPCNNGQLLHCVLLLR